MTIEVTNVQRARVYQEQPGSFAEDETGTLASFLDLPFIEGTMSVELLEPLEAPLHAQQHIDAWPIKVHMPKRARASFDINLTGLGLAIGTRADAALGVVLSTAFGGWHAGTGSTIASTSTTTVLNVTSDSGYAKGAAIAAATGPGGRLEMREIKNVSGGAVTLKHALSSIPANGSYIYACVSVYPSRARAYSLQMIVEGLEQDDRWLLLGGQVVSPPTFTLANGAIARMSFQWEFADWYQADGVSTASNLTSGALATATYEYAVPMVVKSSELRVFTPGTTSLSNTLVDASAYEYTTSLAYTPHLAPGGTQNIIEWIRLRTAPFVSGSFTFPLQDMTWWTTKAADTRKAFSLQIGSSPTLATGGGVLITAPSIQITDVQPNDTNGIRTHAVSWEGTVDGDIASAAAANDLHNAAMRIHMF